MLKKKEKGNMDKGISIAFADSVFDVSCLFGAKYKLYGDSYFNDDSSSRYFAGLRRKFLRLENHFKNKEGSVDKFGGVGLVGDSFKDTLQDIAVYALMELTILKLNEDQRN